MSTLFRTGDGSDEAVLFVTLQIVTPLWFRQSIMTALDAMCDESNWTQDGTSTTDFARDKSVEMLNSITFSTENPNTMPQFPVGMFAPYIDDIIPPGWLECKGQSVSRTTYSALFAIIGTKYGSADGASFSLPDMRKRGVVGAYHGVLDYEIGDMAGQETHILTELEMPAHTHTEHVQNSAGSAGSGWVQSTRTQQGTPRDTGSTGGGMAHENRSPQIAFPWMVYTGVV